MRLNTFCLCCQINKQASMIDSFPDEKKKLAYMQNCLLYTSSSGTPIKAA